MYSSTCRLQYIALKDFGAVGDTTGNSDQDTSYHHINIWMPIGVNFGHASLDLSNGQYISWWPKEVSLQKQGKSNSYPEDIKEEGRSPDYIYRVSSTKLDPNEMMKCWDKQKTKSRYSLLRQNCCSVVYNILHAGGAPKSLTIVWRPETLRRYLVIYLGGGSSIKTLFNMPGWDSPFKEKIRLHTWEATVQNERHFALSLDDSVYVSWWPCAVRATGQVAEHENSLMEDLETIGRSEDMICVLPDNKLEYHLMRRRWKQMSKHTSRKWKISSDTVVCDILHAGGMCFMK